ncbi:hypothetical protein H0X06_05265 [Candidatus Dependentiae bacterium]|nr:hypothetical protein [Candidatus Dependentiae bacterium]
MSTKTGRVLHTFDGEEDGSTVGFNQYGTMIISGSNDNKVRFWKSLWEQYPWTAEGKLTMFQVWLINKMAHATEIDKDPSFTIANNTLEHEILQTLPDNVIQCLKKWYVPCFKMLTNQPY